MSSDQDEFEEYFNKLGPAPEMWDQKKGCLGVVVSLLLAGVGALAGIWWGPLLGGAGVAG